MKQHELTPDCIPGELLDQTFNAAYRGIMSVSRVMMDASLMMPRCGAGSSHSAHYLLCFLYSTANLRMQSFGDSNAA
jgi:hypothetical protein